MKRARKVIRQELPCTEFNEPFSVSISIPLLAIVAVAFAPWLQAADAPAPPSPGSRAAKVELKLLVPADKVAAATKMLKLDAKPGVKEQVFFFDTTNFVLEANSLILRARQKVGHPADSTVKFRTASASSKLSATEKSISPEEDWTSKSAPAISRSLDYERLPDGLLGAVDRGEWTVDKLFNDAQRQMVEARLKNFNWPDLRRFGPIQAELWDDQFKLKDFPEDVTVERWHVERDGKTLDILELSAKARPGKNGDARELAEAFFQSAEKAGFGRPGGKSKTRLVFDFFNPGR